MLFTTNGHLRPYRSAAMPNSTAPTDRNMSTRVMPHVMSVLERPNSSEREVIVRETVKKSRESQVWICKWPVRIVLRGVKWGRGDTPMPRGPPGKRPIASP